jgi:hypothetical protein
MEMSEGIQLALALPKEVGPEDEEQIASRRICERMNGSGLPDS